MSKDPQNEDAKIISFPSKRERKKIKAPTQPAFLNLKKITPLSGFLCLSFLIVHLCLFVFADAADRLEVFQHFGFVPQNFFGGLDFKWYTPLTVITHMFIHGSWMHVLVNIAMMLAMGILFERAYGSARCAVFFFLCGFAGVGLFAALNLNSTTPIIGASGGISGLFAGALLLMQQQNPASPLARFKPWKLIAFWSGLTVVVGLIGGDNIAWQVHLGGLLAGAGLMWALRSRFG